MSSSSEFSFSHDPPSLRYTLRLCEVCTIIIIIVIFIITNYARLPRSAAPGLYGLNARSRRRRRRRREHKMFCPNDIRVGSLSCENRRAETLPHSENSADDVKSVPEELSSRISRYLPAYAYNTIIYTIRGRIYAERTRARHAARFLNATRAYNNIVVMNV